MYLSIIIYFFAWHGIFVEGKSLGNQVAVTIYFSGRNNNIKTMANSS